MGILAGKKGLVVGIANHRSIAYGIAEAAVKQGADLALTYQSPRLHSKVAPLAQELGASILMQCDLTDESEIESVVQELETKWGKLDFLVHAVAFAKREELDGRFLDTSRDGFARAMDVSVYSLVALVRGCEGLLKKANNGASVVTLSYYGAQKAVPNYNVMGVAKAALESAVRYLALDLGREGIRVNAISSGAIKTLSAAGIKGMRSRLGAIGEQVPLGRNISLDDLGKAGVAMLSDLSSGMTGEIVHVDSGYHALGAFLSD